MAAAKNTGINLEHWNDISDRIKDSDDTDSDPTINEEEYNQNLVKELVQFNMFVELLPEYETLTRMHSGPITRQRKSTTSCRHLVILITLSKRAYKIWEKIGNPASPTARNILSVMWRTILIKNYSRHMPLYNFFMMNNAQDFLSEDKCHIITQLKGTKYIYKNFENDEIKGNDLKSISFPCTMALVKILDDGTVHISHYFSIVEHGHNQIKGYSAYGSENLQALPFLFNLNYLSNFVKFINEDPTNEREISFLFEKCFAQNACKFQFRDESHGIGYKTQFLLDPEDIKNGIQKEIETYRAADGNLKFMLACFPTVSELLMEESFVDFPPLDKDLTRLQVQELTRIFSGGGRKKKRFRSKRKYRPKTLKTRRHRKSFRYKN